MQPDSMRDVIELLLFIFYKHMPKILSISKSASAIVACLKSRLEPQRKSVWSGSICVSSLVWWVKWPEAYPSRLPSRYSYLKGWQRVCNSFDHAYVHGRCWSLTLRSAACCLLPTQNQKNTQNTEIGAFAVVLPITQRWRCPKGTFLVSRYVNMLVFY